jgi:acetolactate synthase small subunit
MSGTTLEISNFIEKMRPYGIIELTRSGLVSMSLGLDYIKK